MDSGSQRRCTTRTTRTTAISGDRVVNRRQRLPTPSPAHDWRALAADRPQRLPELSAGAEHDVELRLRHDGRDVPVVTLTGAMTTDDPAALRAVAVRLHAAADALEVAR